MENYRLGNIELRQTKSLRDVHYWEIVCWYPNCYYQKESEYDWDEYSQRYRSRQYPGHYIDKNCFKHPESCYTIAYFERDNDEEPDLKSVGSRPYQLKDEDYDNFHKVAKYAYDNWEEMYGVETY